MIVSHDGDMNTARDMMHPGAQCIPAHEGLDRAAQMMRDMNVGALPICGPDGKLTGILTDRDIVVKCIATGQDPAKMTAADLAQGTPVWVDIDADEEDVLSLMEGNRIRRVPVIEDHQLMGMITEGDLSQHISEDKLAHFVSAVSQAPPTQAQQTRQGKQTREERPRKSL
jgi:CBS domain-containing protein